MKTLWLVAFIAPVEVAEDTAWPLTYNTYWPLVPSKVMATCVHTLRGMMPPCGCGSRPPDWWIALKRLRPPEPGTSHKPYASESATSAKLCAHLVTIAAIFVPVGAVRGLIHVSMVMAEVIWRLAGLPAET